MDGDGSSAVNFVGGSGTAAVAKNKNTMTAAALMLLYTVGEAETMQEGARRRAGHLGCAGRPWKDPAMSCQAGSLPALLPLAMITIAPNTLKL
jgi:hypothetical protein